jgi:3-hydroxyisobutyrate dehydrogenase-like beta-hydroxyacid dehydrogenase
MKIAVVGTGEMGLAMAGHLLDKGQTVSAFDVNAERLGLARDRGIAAVSSLKELAKTAEVFILVVATDEQVVEVSEQLAQQAADGAAIVVAATISVETVRDLGPRLAERGKRLVDAPVVYGASGARAGTLLSLAPGRWPRPATTCCTGCIASPISRPC